MTRFGLGALVGAALLGFLGLAPAGAQTPAPPAAVSQPVEIAHWDEDLQVTDAGIAWQSSDVAYTALTSQGVESVRRFTLSYVPAYETLSVSNAYTLKKDGTKLPVAASDILRGRGASSGSGYSDTQTITIVFPNVEPGDQVVLQTLHQQNVPWFKGVFAQTFYFPRTIAVREASVAITTQGDDSQFHISFNGLEAGPTQKAGNATRRSWRYRNDAPEKDEPGGDYEPDDRPHVAITTLGDFGAVARIYAGNFAGKTEVTPEIQALADQVTKDAHDKRARAAALYNWVSGHIKYVDIVLGAGGFIPNSAAQVLKNGFGDCKDHVMLLEALLAAKGISSTPVLINAGAGELKLPATASPFLFNHLISYIPELDLYADSTAQYAPFGTLPGSDSATQVVLVKTAKLAQTPPIKAAANVSRADSKITVAADGSADGETDVTASGDLAITLRALVAAVSPDKDEALFQSLFGAGSTGTLDRGRPDDLTTDYVFKMRYHIASYAVVPGPGALIAQGYSPVALLSVLGTALPPSRIHDYFCPSMTVQQTTTLTLPSGVAITSMPASQTLTVDGTELRSSFEQIGPDTVRRSLLLRQDHNAPVCSPEYYAKVRDGLLKMTNTLRAQVLYK